MICSEDKLLTICLPTPITDDSRLSAAKVTSLTTMNVHHSNVSMKLKKLRRELLSKQNTRSNNNYDTTITSVQILKRILDHAHSLAATGRDNNLTFIMLQHSGQCFLLVGSQSDGQVPSVSIHVL